MRGMATEVTRGKVDTFTSGISSFVHCSEVKFAEPHNQVYFLPHIHTHAHTHTHIYILTHTHIYIYIHTDTHTHIFFFPQERKIKQ